MDYNELEKRICKKLNISVLPDNFTTLKDFEPQIIYLIVQALAEYDKMRREEPKTPDAK